MNAHEVYDFRQVVTEGVVVAVDDTGQAQTVDVQTPTGLRTGIEVRQSAGFASNPPIEGATVLLLAIGADPGNLVALPVTNTSQRFGKLAHGEGIVYGSDGSRVHVKQGGVVDVVGMSRVRVLSPAVEIDAPSGCTVNAAAGVTIIAAAGVTVNGPATVNGSVSVNGSIIATGNIVSAANVYWAGGQLTT